MRMDKRLDVIDAARELLAAPDFLRLQAAVRLAGVSAVALLRTTGQGDGATDPALECAQRLGSSDLHGWQQALKAGASE